jgi:CPA2 family monovalent cation:H+ antiporter-2
MISLSSQLRRSAPRLRFSGSAFPPSRAFLFPAPCLILKVDSERVREGRLLNEPIYQGDVSSGETLGHARAQKARAVVLLINDHAAARRAMAACRHHAPATPLFVRMRYLADRAELLAAGAAEVVCEEVEGALEMMARVLRRGCFPRNLLAERGQDARAETGSSARDLTVPRPHVGKVAEVELLKVERFLVRATAHASGKSIAALRLRSETGALVVAVHRGGAAHDTPDVTLALAPGDTLFLMGSGPSLTRATVLLETGELPEQIS